MMFLFLLVAGIGTGVYLLTVTTTAWPVGVGVIASTLWIVWFLRGSFTATPENVR